MITPEAKQYYLKDRGFHCPYCGSEIIESDPVTLKNDNFMATVTCLDCGKIWEDVYEITDILEE